MATTFPACFVSPDGSPPRSKELIDVQNPAVTELLPALLFSAPQARKRVLEFFATQIHNDHTRKAYVTATRTFSACCEARAIHELGQVEPIHVAAYVKELGQHRAPPTVKQHLAVLRMLFDWLVTGHVLVLNPAHAVRGPKHVVKKGKTPVLTAEEARALLDSVPSSIVGLRDRALIGVMTYTFARVNATVELKVKDYYVQGRRGWLHLREKGGERTRCALPSQSRRYLDEYMAAARIGDQAEGPLFRTATGRTGTLTANGLSQQNAYRMVQRRSKAAGIRTRIGNHTFRATGITAYLRNGDSLEMAQHIAGHESPRTTKLYHRRREEISLDEVERIAICQEVS